MIPKKQQEKCWSCEVDKYHFRRTQVSFVLNPGRRFQEIIIKQVLHLNSSDLETLILCESQWDQ